MIAGREKAKGQRLKVKAGLVTDCGSRFARSALRIQSGFSLRPSQRAFSAVELTGVLAIMAILAAAIIPNVLRRIDRATWERETGDINAMANGLVRTILNDKQVPATTNIPVAVAKYLDLSVSQVTNTPRGFSRMFLVDPNLKINGTGLPYTQGNGGSATAPTNARVLILSTIAQPSVSSISDSFANIWNTPSGGKPSTWTGKQDDLCIQRVELGGLFHKLYLLNVDTNYNGYYALQTNTPSYVAPGGASITIYVLDGTALGLYAGGVSTNLQIRALLMQDESYVYQDNRWTRDLSEGQLNETLGEYGTWVQKFLNQTPPPYPDNHATPQAVIDQFYTYLWAYWVWGSANFEGINDGTTTTQDPLFRVVGDAQVELNNFSNNLIH